MKVSFENDGRRIVVSTEHAASSHGQPVVLVNDELTDIRAEVEYSLDEADTSELDDECNDDLRRF